MMTTTVEMDKAGRFVIPKKLRDALHLVPGTRMMLRQSGDTIVLEAEARGRGLYRKKGTLVYDPGPLPPLDVVKQIEHGRDERLALLFGDTAQ